MNRFIALFLSFVSLNASAGTEWNCSPLAHWNKAGQLVPDYKTVSILAHDWSTDTFTVQVGNENETLLPASNDWYEGVRFAFLPSKDYFVVRETGSSAVCSPIFE